MADPNYRKKLDYYDAHYLYEGIGQLQAKYEFIRELWTRIKDKLKTKRKKYA